MKRCALLLALLASPALAADIGVSITVDEPGFYGRIDIGNLPAPRVVYPKPIVIKTVPAARPAPPLYLRVPPGHAKNWLKYCHKYDACGQPVYFVRDDWYNDVYVPGKRDRHEKDRGDHGKGHGKGHDKEHGKGRD